MDQIQVNQSNSSVTGHANKNILRTGNTSFNYNNTIDVETQRLNTVQQVLSVTVLIFIVICALTGNTLVIWAFTRYRRLRRVTNYFIVSLASSDILVALLAMPVWIAFQTGSQGIFKNKVLQKVWTSADVFSSTASIIHLSFVSLDRYLCITSPLTYHSRMTRRRASLIILFIWIYSFFMSLLQYLVWEFHYFILIVTVFTFVLPLLLISIGYYKIFQAARYQAKQISLTVRGKSRKFSLTRELKAARTIGVVISAFVICWAPFFILMDTFTYITKDIPYIEHLIAITKVMHYGNSMLNPIIYTLMNKEFSDQEETPKPLQEGGYVSQFRRVHSEPSAFKQIVLMKAWSAFTPATTPSVAQLERSSHSDDRTQPVTRKEDLYSTNGLSSRV